MTEKISKIMNVMEVWKNIIEFLESTWGWEPLPTLLGSIIAVCLLYMPAIALAGWLYSTIVKTLKNL